MAKSRALAKRSGITTFTPLVVQELQQMEQAVGGRQELVGLLSLAPLNPDLRYALGVLGDPQHQHKTLATICTEANILPGDLLKHLETAALLKGRVLSAQLIGRGLPAVVQDVMQRAAPFEGTCHTCQGCGKITAEPTPTVPNPIPDPCYACGGTGLLIYPPDIEHQKLALDMGRMLQKGGGLSIVQNNANLPGGGSGGGMGGGSLERLHLMTDQILYQDADVLPDEPEEPSNGEV